ncbi:MAG: hypothetical protein J5I93_00700 [Pirellulaceae bacterium]|nr:hypothetical protein [Pirellulaceae bacterium]
MGALDAGVFIVLAFFAGRGVPSGGGGAIGQWEVIPKAIDFPLRVVALGTVVIVFLVSAPQEAEGFGLDFRDLTGRRLKLLERIDTSADLTKGRWLLVFVRDNCAKCDHALKQLKDATRQRQLPLAIALVKIPPFGAASADTYASWEHARYDSAKPYIRTPQFVILEDAVVREASWITPELDSQSLLTRE